MKNRAQTQRHLIPSTFTLRWVRTPRSGRALIRNQFPYNANHGLGTSQPSKSFGETAGLGKLGSREDEQPTTAAIELSMQATHAYRCLQCIHAAWMAFKPRNDVYDVNEWTASVWRCTRSSIIGAQMLQQNACPIMYAIACTMMLSVATHIPQVEAPA